MFEDIPKTLTGLGSWLKVGAVLTSTQTKHSCSCNPSVERVGGGGEHWGRGGEYWGSGGECVGEGSTMEEEGSTGGRKGSRRGGERGAPRVGENEAVRGKIRSEKSPEAAACCIFGCITS